MFSCGVVTSGVLLGSSGDVDMFSCSVVVSEALLGYSGDFDALL